MESNAITKTQESVLATTPSGMPLDLSERLKPATADQASAALKVLAVSFDVEISRERAAIYFEAIQGEPVWAIKRAAREFRLGSAPNHQNRAFMPTPALLGERVRQITRPHRDNAAPRPKPRQTAEFAKLGSVVKVGTEESRAEFAAKMMARLNFGPSSTERGA